MPSPGKTSTALLAGVTALLPSCTGGPYEPDDMALALTDIPFASIDHAVWAEADGEVTLYVTGEAWVAESSSSNVAVVWYAIERPIVACFALAGDVLVEDEAADCSAQVAALQDPGPWGPDLERRLRTLVRSAGASPTLVAGVRFGEDGSGSSAWVGMAEVASPARSAHGDWFGEDTSVTDHVAIRADHDGSAWSEPTLELATGSAGFADGLLVAVGEGATEVHYRAPSRTVWSLDPDTEHLAGQVVAEPDPRWIEVVPVDRVFDYLPVGVMSDGDERLEVGAHDLGAGWTELEGAPHYLYVDRLLTLYTRRYEPLDGALAAVHPFSVGRAAAVSPTELGLCFNRRLDPTVSLDVAVDSGRALGDALLSDDGQCATLSAGLLEASGSDTVAVDGAVARSGETLPAGGVVVSAWSQGPEPVEVSHLLAGTQSEFAAMSPGTDGGVVAVPFVQALSGWLVDPDLAGRVDIAGELGASIDFGQQGAAVAPFDGGLWISTRDLSLPYHETGLARVGVPSFHLTPTDHPDLAYVDDLFAVDSGVAVRGGAWVLHVAHDGTITQVPGVIAGDLDGVVRNGDDLIVHLDDVTVARMSIDGTVHETWEIRVQQVEVGAVVLDGDLWVCGPSGLRRMTDPGLRLMGECVDLAPGFADDEAFAWGPDGAAWLLRDDSLAALPAHDLPWHEPVRAGEVVFAHERDVWARWGERLWVTPADLWRGGAR